MERARDKRRAVSNNDEGNKQDSGAQDSVCWAQRKASGDTICKNNTPEADARTRFKGRPALSYVEVLKSDAGVTDTEEELTACMQERAERRASNPLDSHIR